MNYVYVFSCYLAGAIPTGYLAGRLLKGIDIRKHGSGNTGATNVFRTLGRGPGLAVLAIDMAKGALAVALLPKLFQVGAQGWVLGGALAAVLGHNYTLFLGFKGGKGVATSAGVMLGLAPYATLTILAVFVAVLVVSRMISVSSLTAATALPALVYVYGETGLHHIVLYLTLLLTVFIWVRHKDNIKRIRAGTENRFEWNSKRSA